MLLSVELQQSTCLIYIIYDKSLNTFTGSIRTKTH